MSEDGVTRYRGSVRETRAEALQDLDVQRERLIFELGGAPTLTPARAHDAEKALRLATAAMCDWSLERLVRLGLEYKAILETRKEITLRDAWERMITALVQENATVEHVRTAKETLSFSEKHALPCLDSELRTLEPEVIRAWMAELPVSPSTLKKWLTYAKSAINRAKKEGYVEESPLAFVKAPKPDEKPVSYLLPAQAHRLLATLRPVDLPYVALGLFAGLRPEAEAQRLRWEDFDWEKLEIHIAKDRTKTARHRVVPMEPALVAYLDSVKAREKSGPILTLTPYQRQKAAAVAKVEWGQDILRHTYATMWLAAHQNKAALAEQMGNSPAVIDQHYRFPLSRKVAEEFWALRP